MKNKSLLGRTNRKTSEQPWTPPAPTPAQPTKPSPGTARSGVVSVNESGPAAGNARSGPMTANPSGVPNQAGRASDAQPAGNSQLATPGSTWPAAAPFK